MDFHAMSPLPPFLLERFFAKFEFEVPVNLCASDLESVPMQWLLDRADAEMKTAWDTLSLGYTESLGHKKLRAEIARVCDVTRDDVVVFSGAQEAIYAWARACLRAGDHVVVVWPAYQSLFEVARAQGCDVTLVPLDPADGWTLRAQDIEAVLRPDTKAIVVNLPHNPTGAHVSRATFDAIGKLAADRGATFVCDEVYRFMEPDAAQRLPCVAGVDARAVSIGVLSKGLGLAGLRIGWIATRDAGVRSQVAAYKDYTTICASAPSELLAIIALRNKEELIERNRKIVDDNLKHAHAFFAGNPRVSWIPPQAGPVAMARLTDGRSSDDFAEHAARAHGVLVLPASVFGRPGPEFRIGLGRLNFADGLARLAAALEEQRP